MKTNDYYYYYSREQIRIQLNSLKDNYVLRTIIINYYIKMRWNVCTTILWILSKLSHTQEDKYESARQLDDRRIEHKLKSF